MRTNFTRPSVLTPASFVLSIVPTMGARLVLNLRSSRREDVTPTGRSTGADDMAFEMHAKVVSHKASGDQIVIGSYGPHRSIVHERDHLTAEERMYLNQIKASSRHYKTSEVEHRWNV
jgi:hypothetical protein